MSYKKTDRTTIKAVPTINEKTNELNLVFHEQGQVLKLEEVFQPYVDKEVRITIAFVEEVLD